MQYKQYMERMLQQLFNPITSLTPRSRFEICMNDGWPVLLTVVRELSPPVVNLCVVSTQATAAGSTRAPKFPNLHAKVPGVVGLAHDRLDLTLHQSIPRI